MQRPPQRSAPPKTHPSLRVPTSARSRAPAQAAKTQQAAARHTLYVKVPEPGDPDASSRVITLNILKFIQARLPIFGKMGVDVKVNKITTTALKDPRLRNAMKARRIDRLPALLTPHGVYLGKEQIETLYNNNITKFKAFASRHETKSADFAPDDLTRFYRKEMSEAAIQEDDEEEGIGRADSMMKQYQQALASRDRSRPQHTGRAQSLDRLAALKPRAQDVARPSAPRPFSIPRVADESGEESGGVEDREDFGQDPDSPGEDSEIQDLIRRMSQNVGGDVTGKAFAGGGGDSLDGDEEGSSAQDKLMEASYWANMESSV